MKALLIGRFQPFHNGHLKIIQNIANKYDEIIIGIGSSQYSHTLDNPFSSDERRVMIQKSLDKINLKNYRIMLIPDIHNPPKWVDHVLSIISDFDIVLSNNSLTNLLFSEKGYIVKQTPLYNEKIYSGKEIRRRLINNEPWKNLVPQDVFDVIKKINGVQRLKKIDKTKGQY